MTVASRERQRDSWSVARSIARHDLVPAKEDDGRIAPRDWPELLAVLSTQRLCGVALHAVEDGALELSPAQYEELLEEHELQLVLDLLVERLVLDCFDVLSAAGIDTRLLKGPSSSRRFYDDPSLRSFGDADLLVPREQFSEAVAVLEELGFSRKIAPPRRWFDRYVKAACFTTRDGLELDLHQMLAPGPYGFRIDTKIMFEHGTDEVLIGQTAIPCLSTPFAWVHACVHAALGDPYPRFVSLRDVVAILRSDPSEQAVTAYVERCALGPVIARALFLVESVLGCRAVGTIAERYRSYPLTRRDRWRLSAYETGGGRFARQSAAALWELPSIADRVAYATALAVPTHEYVAARASTYRGRFRQAVALAVRWRPR